MPGRLSATALGPARDSAPDPADEGAHDRLTVHPAATGDRSTPSAYIIVPAADAHQECAVVTGAERPGAHFFLLMQNVAHGIIQTQTDAPKRALAGVALDPLGGSLMTVAADEKTFLIQTLLDEASDVDLVCYLAHSGGATAMKDLLESVRDADSLSNEDLMHNIGVVRQKKNEARACPMHRVFRRLMKSDAMPVVPDMTTGNELGLEARLH
jgi:hypothetical protein